MQATCKYFHEYCALNGISLARKNFTLSWDTNIPRQVIFSSHPHPNPASSAATVIGAALRCTPGDIILK